MKIELNHVTELGNYVDMHLCVSTEDGNSCFEKLLGLTKESGRYLVIHARKEKSVDGSYPYSAFIEGTIYDEEGEVCKVPDKMFQEDCLGRFDEIDKWINGHQEEWINVMSNQNDIECSNASLKENKMSKNQKANDIINNAVSMAGGNYVSDNDKTINYFLARYNNNSYYIEYEGEKCITLEKIK